MRRLSILGTVLVVITSVASAQDAASCPAPRFQPQLMTPPALQIPRDAALVVGLFAAGATAGGVNDLPPVTLTRRNREVAFVREAIAPGLYRLRPDATRMRGRYDLTGVPGAPPLVFGRPGIGAPPAQPSVERVERYLVAGAGGSRTELRAHLSFPMPARVVAVLVFWGDDPEPDLFARAAPTSSSVVLYRSSGDCSELPRGASAPPRNGTVSVAFVDGYGQVSARSEAVTIGG